MFKPVGLPNTSKAKSLCRQRRKWKKTFKCGWISKIKHMLYSQISFLKFFSVIKIFKVILRHNVKSIQSIEEKYSHST